MTRLLTPPPVIRKIRPNTDILVQPHALEAIKQTHPKPQGHHKRRINYAKKITNDPFIFTV